MRLDMYSVRLQLRRFLLGAAVLGTALALSILSRGKTTVWVPVTNNIVKIQFTKVCKPLAAAGPGLSWAECDKVRVAFRNVSAKKEDGQVPPTVVEFEEQK